MFELFISQSNQSFFKLKEINAIINLFDFNYNFDETNMTKAELQELFIDRYGERQTNGATAIEFKKLFKSVWKTGILQYGKVLQLYLQNVDLLEANYNRTNVHENAQTIDNETSEPAITIVGGQSTSNQPRIKQAQALNTDETTTETITGDLDAKILKIKDFLDTDNVFDKFFEYVAKRVLYKGVL